MAVRSRRPRTRAPDPPDLALVGLGLAGILFFLELAWFEVPLIVLIVAAVGGVACVVVGLGVGVWARLAPITITFGRATGSARRAAGDCGRVSDDLRRLVRAHGLDHRPVGFNRGRAHARRRALTEYGVTIRAEALAASAAAARHGIDTRDLDILAANPSPDDLVVLARVYAELARRLQNGA